MNTDLLLNTLDLSSFDCMRSTITLSHHIFTDPKVPDETPRLNKSVVIQRRLGSGGMGIVYLAEQQQPKRLVAVKGLREDCKHLKPNLIQEAMITGALEHPNIVPVHFLHEANSQPQVVMKYINGKTLNAVCDNQGVSGSKLRQIIRQLIQVCYALSYAHTKGVYHRDVKPENIMLGDFGEVYLLDWGIAISKSQPMSKPQLVGSPAYMAPEMVEGDPTLIDQRTDVFLLGATLHEVLTGEPRHAGDNIHEVIESINAIQPHSYGAKTPEELGRICNEACAKSPSHRIQSIDLFQQRLEDYLQHEQAIILSHSAQEEMNEVERILKTSSQSETRLLAHYNRARFGFNQALQIWPECLQAKTADNKLLTIMLEYYLHKSDLNRSKNIYEQMTTVNPATEQKIKALELEEEIKSKENIRLAGIAHSQDPKLTQKARRWLSMVIILVCLAFVYIVVFSPYSDISNMTNLSLLTVSCTIYVPILLFVWILRKEFLVNNHGKKIAFAISSMLMAMIIHRFVAWLIDEPVTNVIITDMILVAAVMANTPPSFKRGPIVALVSLGTIPLIIYFPALLNLCSAFLALFMGGLLYYEWVIEENNGDINANESDGVK